ncbi:MAG: adenosylcobinamide-GDP ribazoletransferase [Acidimicrobiales bacterium]|nr:adenosylcobinamide-GDP ribazoletransferase [Acidimicrobiales bacterium]
MAASTRGPRTRTSPGQLAVRRALAFLTSIGSAAPPNGGTLLWFPAAGFLIGLIVGTTWWGAAQIWPPVVAAAVALTIDLAVTGVLHFDGLVDTADGLLPPVSRERRLEIMADPRAGAFGVVVAASLLLLRWSALASSTPEPLVLAGLWCASRSVASGSILAVPYARPDGLAASFAGETSTQFSRLLALAVVGIVLSVGPASVGAGWLGLIACAGCFAGGLGVITWAQDRLGGFTGDVLGAAIVVGETAGLLLLAVR